VLCVVTGGKVVRECLADSQQEDVIIRCPLGEFIISVEVAFILNKNFGGRNCKLICKPTSINDNLPDACKEQQLCTIYFDDYDDCDEYVNVVKVKYHCSKGKLM